MGEKIESRKMSYIFSKYNHNDSSGNDNNRDIYNFFDEVKNVSV